MVKVDTSPPIQTTTTRRTRKKGAAQGSSAAFSTESAGSAGDGAPQTQAPQTVDSPKNVEALVAIQDVANLTPNQRSFKRGTELLDSLEGLRNSLLLGSIDKKKLETLKELANENVPPSNNPELEKTRQLIEQRVHIELAKLVK